MYLLTRWFGTFLCDKNLIKKKVLFPKNPKEIARRLIKMDKKEIPFGTFHSILLQSGLEENDFRK